MVWAGGNTCENQITKQFPALRVEVTYVLHLITTYGKDACVFLKKKYTSKQAHFGIELVGPERLQAATMVNASQTAF